MNCKQCKNITVCMAQADVLGQVFDPNYDGEHGCTDFVPFTNADRIRSMGDEGLAVLLAHETYRMAKPVFDMCGYGITEEFIFVQRLDWLQQPAE